MTETIPQRALVRTVEPYGQTITTAQAKTWARIEIDDDDADVSRMIAEAESWIEDWCDRQLLRATYQLTLPSFLWLNGSDCNEWGRSNQRLSGRTILLPRPPLVAVSSVTYRDAAGSSQTFSSASYHVATAYKPGFIQLKDGYDWPETEQDNPNAVVIQYTAGETDNTTVPQRIKNTVGRLVAAAYDQRRPVVECDIPAEVFRLLGPYRRIEAV